MPLGKPPLACLCLDRRPYTHGSSSPALTSATHCLIMLLAFQGACAKVEAVTSEFDLADVHGRAAMVLVMAKLYMLLARMAQVVTPLAGRHPIFSTIQRGGGATIYFQGDSVIKCIPNFQAHCTQHQTTLAILQDAYKAAGEEVSQAVSVTRRPTLPRVSDVGINSSDVYSVTTGPLGYDSTPGNEQVCVRCGLSDPEVAPFPHIETLL